MTTLTQANEHLRNKRYPEAIALYIQSLRAMPDLGGTIIPNVALARSKYLARRRDEKPRTAICLCAPAKTALDLAERYQAFAETEIINCMKNGNGPELKEPNIPVHNVSEDSLDQFVPEHPYDVIHLVDGGQPSIIMGALYKLIWGATVLAEGPAGPDCFDAILEPGLDARQLQAAVNEARNNPFSSMESFLVKIKGRGIPEIYLRLGGGTPTAHQLNILSKKPGIKPQTIPDKAMAGEPVVEFDSEYYLERYEDVRASGMDPLLHYTRFGKKEGRFPTPPLNDYWWARTDRSIQGETFETTGRVYEALERMKANPFPPAVIIPVYNAPGELEECLDSVKTHTPEDVRIILIDDASPDPRIREILAPYENRTGFSIYQNHENMGYTRTVNRGMEIAGRSDVVLLNSDTRVTPGWLRNLRLAAYSGDRVGTATPFSNNAGSFSVPDMDRENPIPPDLTLEDYARAVTRAAQRSYPLVPTGNGFCMYIRRDCIDETGEMDVQAFPRGYGEENDFCMRAGTLGWKHVIDDSTFIHHARSASFIGEKSGLREAGMKVIHERYPDYSSLVRRSFSSSQLREAQERIRRIHETNAIEASRSKKRRILFVLTIGSGGIPQTNQDLMDALSGYAETFVLRCDAGNLTLMRYAEGKYTALETHHLNEPLRPFPHRSVEYDRIAADLLVRHAFELVHIRHIALHSLGLVDVAKEIRLPVVFSFHDFYTVCPTVKLLDDKNLHCRGVCSRGDGRCAHELWPRQGFPRLKHGAVHDWRTQMITALQKCDALITTSQTAKDLVLSSFPELEGKGFPVIPHGRDFEGFHNLARPIIEDRPIRLVAPGNISRAKGGHIIAALGRLGRDIGLEVHVLGETSGDIDFGPEVILHGPYSRSSFAEKIKEIKPHLGGIFSIWPETHCHTLTELWSCGIPVIGLDFGAVGERLRRTSAGWLVEKPTAEAVIEEIGRISKNPALQQTAIKNVLSWQSGTALQATASHMALAYEDIYEKIGTTGLHDKDAFSSAQDPADKQEYSKGVSIIILTHNGAGHLERLLDTFSRTNTHHPVELIIIDHGSTDNTAEVVAGHESKLEIRHINRHQNYSFSSSCNFGAALATHPNLLFLNNDIIYTSDMLPHALAKLNDPSIGAIGVRLDDDPESLPPGKEPGVQHAGIQFKWNEKRGYHQPEQIRHPSIKDFQASQQNQNANPFPAVTAACLLCRKSDFEQLAGFSEEYDYGLEDMDFCLRLGRDLKKKCWCINGMSLQHVDGATRRLGDKKVRSELIENNHKIFKKKWDNYIREMSGKHVSKQKAATATTLLVPESEPALTKTELAGEPELALQGAILPNTQSETVVHGWLAKLGDHTPRAAILRIDNQHSFELNCNLFRKELKKKNINAARHGFEFIVPISLADGKPHRLELIDQQTQVVVTTASQTWRIHRKFADFSGFLAHSLTMPMLSAPFRDADRLCLDHMDRLADLLLSVSDTLADPPKVSIIMPAFNRAGIIRDSILSALNQYYTNLELLVVDDGSTDGTGQVLSVFKDPRLKVLRNDRNRGQCYSLNRAIAEAQGEYIAYLDSDNTWDARYVAAMVGAFAKLPAADALYCGQYLFRGADTPFAVRFGALNRSLLVNRNYIDRNAFIHKKAVHDGLGGYDVALARYVDWDFIIRTSEKYTLYSVPVVLSMYYYDLAANTMTNDDRHIRDLDVIRANQKERAGQHQRETAQTLPLAKAVSMILFDCDTLPRTRECIDAVQSLELGASAEVLAPAAADPETLRYLEALAADGKIRLVPTDKHAGFFPSLDTCVAAAQPGRDILLVSGRATLTPGAVQVLQDTAAAHPDGAVVVPQQVLPPGTKAIREHVPYGNPTFACDVGLSARSENVVNLPTYHDGNLVELTRAEPFCAYIKREALAHIQGLNPQTEPPGESPGESFLRFCDYVRHVLQMKIYHTPKAVVHVQ